MMKSITGMTEKELIQSLKVSGKDSESAFREIYARYSQVVFLYCRKILFNNRDINDVFQEVWIRFHEAAKKDSTHIENVGGYLLKIARNLCLTYKSRQRSDLSVDDFQFPSYDRPYEEKELFSIIDRATSLLDDIYKEAFVLHELEGLTYEEISEITGDSISALKMRVMRARRQLKDILSPVISEFNS